MSLVKVLLEDLDVKSFSLDKLKGPPGVEKVVHIGRGGEAEISLDSKRCPLLISRRHAVICKRQDKLFLKDCNSTNGTFVNDVRLEKGEECQIHECDTVSFGGASKVRQSQSSQEEYNPFLYKLKNTRTLFAPGNFARHLEPVQIVTSAARHDVTAASAPTARKISAPTEVNVAPVRRRKNHNSDVVDLTDTVGEDLEIRARLASLAKNKKKSSLPMKRSFDRQPVVDLSDDSPPPNRAANQQTEAVAGPSSAAEKNEGLVNAMHAEFECQICRDIMVAAHTLVPCGHMFCGECVTEWLEKKKNCPSCRKATEAAPVPSLMIDNMIEDHIVPTMDHEAKQDRARRKAEWSAKAAACKAKMESLHRQGRGLGGNLPVGHSHFAHMHFDISGQETMAMHMLMGGHNNRTSRGARMHAPAPLQIPTPPNRPSLGWSIARVGMELAVCNACNRQIAPGQVKLQYSSAKYHASCESRAPGFLQSWLAQSGQLPGAQLLHPSERTRMTQLAQGRR